MKILFLPLLVMGLLVMPLSAMAFGDGSFHYSTTINERAGMNMAVVTENQVVVNWLARDFMRGQVLIDRQSHYLPPVDHQDVLTNSQIINRYGTAMPSDYGVTEVTYNQATINGLSSGTYYLRPISYDWLGKIHYGNEMQVTIN